MAILFFLHRCLVMFYFKTKSLV